MERIKTWALALIAVNLTLYSIFALATAANAQFGDGSTLSCSGYIPRTCAVRVIIVSGG